MRSPPPQGPRDGLKPTAAPRKPSLPAIAVEPRPLRASAPTRAAVPADSPVALVEIGVGDHPQQAFGLQVAGVAAEVDLGVRPAHAEAQQRAAADVEVEPGAHVVAEA